MATLHPKLSEELSQTTVSSTQSVKLKIKRSNPNVNSDEKFDDFVVLEDSEVGMASAHAAGLPVYKVLDVDDVDVEFIKNILKERK